MYMYNHYVIPTVLYVVLCTVDVQMYMYSVWVYVYMYVFCCNMQCTVYMYSMCTCTCMYIVCNVQYMYICLCVIRYNPEHDTESRLLRHRAVALQDLAHSIFDHDLNEEFEQVHVCMDLYVYVMF